MTRRKIISELLLTSVTVYFFYEGIFKLFHLHRFRLWLHHAPFLHAFAGPMAYGTPITELLICLLLLIPATQKRGLLTSIIACMVHILWIISIFLFTNRIFWPYHEILRKPTWMQIMTVSLLVCWFSFAALAAGNYNTIKSSTLSMPLNDQLINS